MHLRISTLLVALVGFFAVFSFPVLLGVKDSPRVFDGLLLIGFLPALFSFF